MMGGGAVMIGGGVGVDDVVMERDGMGRSRGGDEIARSGVRLSWAYCVVSVLVAVLAVVTSSSPALPVGGKVEGDGKADATVNADAGSKMSALEVENVAMAAYTAVKNKKLLSDTFSEGSSVSSEDKSINNKDKDKDKDKFLRWLLPSPRQAQPSHQAEPNAESSPESLFWKALIDPALLAPDRSTVTDVIDKVLTSTPRLLAIANLLLAVTYLLHSAVADLFLGHPALNTNNNNNSMSSLNHRRAGRERLGGFLLFKLLLISAVVEPDTLDLLILLSWYTLLSFLRSLAHLANATTSHTSQAGQPPPKGVLRLLALLLLADLTAAASCFLLFYEAGPSMVFLLEADTALLAIDIFSHMARHFTHKSEEAHQLNLATIEQQQLALHSNNDNDIQDQSRALDRQIERLENYHNRKLAFLDAVVLALELASLALTVCHFLHIWSLHGLSFGLVDCVLALHLHTAISAAGKKIAEKRNLNKIHRDLDGHFQDATELEMRKANAAGDVCCICLGTMSASNVKKVACGHLYHTHCLREVVERARSIHAARCPLCRSSIVHTDNSTDSSDSNSNNTSNTQTNNNNNNTPADNNVNNNLQEQQQQQDIQNNNQQQINAPPPLAAEHALFRFSTEGILPAWLPLPAFSFEVVRRPSNNNNNNNTDNNNNTPQHTPQTQQQQINQRNDNTNNQTIQQQNQQQGEMSFWRRLLILAGAIPMSPEEEAAAITQLVDMFPQYQRADLLRELRDRGSPEAVVEAVLTGAFSGLARNGAFTDDPTNNTNTTTDIQPNTPTPTLATNDDDSNQNDRNNDHHENNNPNNHNDDHNEENNHTHNQTDSSSPLTQEQQRLTSTTTTIAASEERTGSNNDESAIGNNDELDLNTRTSQQSQN